MGHARRIRTTGSRSAATLRLIDWFHNSRFIIEDNSLLAVSGFLGIFRVPERDVSQAVFRFCTQHEFDADFTVFFKLTIQGIFNYLVTCFRVD